MLGAMFLTTTLEVIVHELKSLLRLLSEKLCEQFEFLATLHQSPSTGATVQPAALIPEANIGRGINNHLRSYERDWRVYNIIIANDVGYFFNGNNKLIS